MTTYADVFRPQKEEKLWSWGYEITLVLAGSLLITLLAKTTIFLGPVPHTGQTLAVLLIGALYGRKRATATLLTYLLEGAVGLPVFAKGAGLSVLQGATGGYLVGFVVAAFVVGWFAELGWDRRILTTVAAMLIGNVIIYAFGLPWLKIVLNWGWAETLTKGMWIFLPTDLVKVGIATFLLPLGWKLLNKSQQ